jgi:hypothetical protein
MSYVLCLKFASLFTNLKRIAAEKLNQLSPFLNFAYIHNTQNLLVYFAAIGVNLDFGRVVVF